MENKFMGKKSKESLKKELNRQIVESAKISDELKKDPDNTEKQSALSESIFNFQKTEKELEEFKPESEE